jgi:competence protein ComFC
MIVFENQDIKIEQINGKKDFINDFNFILNGSGQLIQHDEDNKYSEDKIIIENKSNLLRRHFFFIKELDYCDNISVKYISTSILIINFERSFHLIFLNDFMIYSFPGNEFHISGDYILFLNEEAYTDCTSVSYINLLNRQRYILDWVVDFFSKWDGYVGLGFEIKNGILEYEGINQKYFFDLNRNSHQLVSNDICNSHKLASNNYWGLFIDFHTIKSTLNDDGSFTTVRTEIGELLYKYKYAFDLTVESELVERISSFVLKHYPYCDILIPLPPSNLNRPYQPLFELVQKISERIRIPCNLNYLKKKKTPPLKSIDDLTLRSEILKDAFYLNDDRYKNKRVLLLDDLFRSGETINASVKTLKEQGKVNDIYVLTITKTRTIK